jgi:hypothetical protein
MRIAGLLISARCTNEALSRLFYADSVISAALLLIAFWPFLAGMVHEVF